MSLTRTISDNRRLSSPRAESALGHVDDKNRSLENLLTIEDLDDAFQNSAINKHNQAEGYQTLTKANNLSNSVDHTSQSVKSIQDQKQDNRGPQLHKEEPQRPISVKPTNASTSADVKTQAQRDVDNSVSIEEIILPANINLAYSRYNGKKKALRKTKSIRKPGRPNSMDSKDKTKAKSKQSQKFDQDDESYHITMAGHMPQVSITGAFCGTEEFKHTVKKENKVEILARLKKGSIHKLFNKPTKVKKFKVKKEKNNKEQQEQKKSKGIRKSIQRVIRNIRKAFISCGCF